MKSSQSISIAHARRIILEDYRRRRSAEMDRGPDSAQRALEESGYIQIDTISRIIRAHHHSFYNRSEHYQPTDLDEAQRRGGVFEYWSHAAAYLPMSSYRYCLPRMERMRRGGGYGPNADAALADEVLRRIRTEGPLMSKDFAHSTRPGGGWWDWKPAKIALEHLFHRGQLVIAGRKNFQKQYALPEQVLPADLDTSPPSREEMADYLIDLTLRNQLFSRGKYLRSQHRDGAEGIPQAVNRQLEEGLLVAVDIEDRGLWYCRPQTLEQSAHPDHMWARIVSPFDGLVIQRAWIAELFDFTYQIECYVPAAKRRYGYFTLPIIGPRGFAGLLDAKAERKNRVFNVISLYLKASKQNDPEFRIALDKEIERFAAFNGCETVECESVLPYE